MNEGREGLRCAIRKVKEVVMSFNGKIKPLSLVVRRWNGTERKGPGAPT